MTVKWASLHEAAEAVGKMAGQPPEPRKADVRNFPAIMRDTGGWRLDLAEQGIEDLVAIMEPGLAALLAASSAGATPRDAAAALWHEFASARAALIALIPPLGIPHRG